MKKKKRCFFRTCTCSIKRPNVPSDTCTYKTTNKSYTYIIAPLTDLQHLLAALVAQLLDVVLLRQRQQLRDGPEVSPVVEAVRVDELEELPDHLRGGVGDLHAAVLALLHVVGEHGAEDVGARAHHELVAREGLPAAHQLHVGVGHVAERLEGGKGRLKQMWETVCTYIDVPYFFF